ncbi:DUF7532 family protein [Halalkalicoccus jeotgali]|uniref:Uncharacterized protein n=1 Tax=Halalkalicoccus jeotgali (strain DSM 18796 / CECT 7217 / JCM 14584 / KCTC 4019 / B3) TaxID=795797 RepID=D8J7R9_HALJB|nr:hypothetical protein [Halalkalicoccus jeotgali]ADJ16089.1 hypothetical protein HacjB3_13540 [Halalkalicoccus jeotgali B3]ELY38184.1 hypothetical protein C497_08749 [Halalkalicoccus jeotgali B3]
MHFDQRTQQALREAGLEREAIVAASDRVAELVAADADDLVGFFEAHGTVYSDMDLAHSREEFPEHAVEYCDLFTHGADIRGYLRFDSWGVPVEGGRVLDEGLVELSLGPTVDARVKFAASRDAL